MLLLKDRGVSCKLNTACAASVGAAQYNREVSSGVPHVTATIVLQAKRKFSRKVVACYWLDYSFCD